MCKYANLLFAHHSSHSHAHHSLCPLAMHFIADCKQNCNSINKLNKNKYEQRLTSAFLSLSLFFFSIYTRPSSSAWLLHHDPSQRPTSQPTTLSAKSARQWPHLNACASMHLYCGSILWQNSNKKMFPCSFSIQFGNILCSSRLFSCARRAQSPSVHMSDNRNVFCRVSPVCCSFGAK